MGVERAAKPGSRFLPGIAHVQVYPSAPSDGNLLHHPPSQRTIASHRRFPVTAGSRRRRSVEDYQEQEYEFLRRLEEERVGRRTSLKRGLVAGAGLTVLSLSPAALAARKKALADPPVIGTPRQAVRHRGRREEGRQAEHDRASARLVELRRGHVDLPEEVRDQHHEHESERQLGRGERGNRLAEGRPARPGRRRRQPDVRRQRSHARSVREVLHDQLQDGPAGDEGRARFLGR